MQMRILCTFVLCDKKIPEIFGVETISFVKMVCYNT